jgi:hypothetical protein
MSKIKTFRGLLADNGQERIRIQHNDGKTGYQIKKFQIMPEEYGGTSNEHTVQIYSVKQTAASADVNFSAIELLAAATVNNSSNATTGPSQLTVIFDAVTFNQDIYITHVDNASSDPCNYYLELEQFDLDDNEATATILKNFRNTNSYAT